MIDELKVGDLIAVDLRLSQGIELREIDRLTPTMYVTKNGTRFYKGSLRIVGPDRWGPFCGRIPTARDMALVRIRQAQEEIKALIVTEENVAAIEAMLKDIAK